MSGTAEKGKAGRGQRAAEARGAKSAGTPYHHGSLRQAMLEAAESILKRDGIQGLTLRAAAREAGVSHAAPKNHFDDIKGLLSELAAVGFQRLAVAMQVALDGAPSTDGAMDAIGRAYVHFARDNPGMFLLMYRGEMLDFTRPALRDASLGLFGLLSGTVARRAGAAQDNGPPATKLAEVTAAWCLVHGFAMLMIDRRLQPILAHVAGADPTETLLDGVLAAVKMGRGSGVDGGSGG